MAINDTLQDLVDKRKSRIIHQENCAHNRQFIETEFYNTEVWRTTRCSDCGLIIVRVIKLYK